MKKALFTLLFIGIASACIAQFHYEYPTTLQKQQLQTIPEKKQGFVFDKSKLTFGGGIGLQFGDYTLVNIAPQVGYNFSKYFNAGLGFSYTYWKNDYYTGNQKLKVSSSYLGFNIYGRYYPVENIVLMLQPEMNRVWQTVEDNFTRNKTTEEKFVPVCLIGGGLRLGPMTAMIQYDVIQDKMSPYGDNLFYSVGYTFSF